MTDAGRERERMVERQIAARGVTDPRVLDAMRRVPREDFVPPSLREFAFEDAPLGIGEGQTISQPYIVARMLEAAAIGPDDRVLDVGAGSGYATAVASRLARRVHAIERIASLADAARERLRAAGCDNVELRTGDGTLGWPGAAPFDAILVAAGGPEVPKALREQLAIGGRLVMPVGDTQDIQRLLRITRTDEHRFDEQFLGDVRFVPLIGEQGWTDKTEKGGQTPFSDPPPTSRDAPLPQRIAAAAIPLAALDDDGFADPFERFAGTRVVLLGEASHGTSEFYRARARITQRLIARHGFNIVAVEADWPDAAVLNRHVRGLPPRDGAEPPFTRFPTWMWRNREVAVFVEWLRARNAGRPAGEQAGFYGLDLYNLNASMRAVIDYLDRVDPEAARVARERYACLTPFRSAPQAYGRMALTKGYAPCEQAAVAMLRELLGKRLEYAAGDGESFLDAAANARLVRDAEAYYRVMYYGSAESWNLRDTHMFETLTQLLDAHGPDSRAVVWAHNSHIGDARATDMGWTRGELNIGQLCRERFGDQAALIGFGTHAGHVAAASDWDAPMEVKRIRPSLADSYERLCHDSAVPRFLLPLAADRPVAQRLLEPRLERFIGVIYRPETERWSHYSEACLPQQFDAWVWFDETTPVTPLPGAGEAPPADADDPSRDDLYPFGL